MNRLMGSLAAFALLASPLVASAEETAQPAGTPAPAAAAATKPVKPKVTKHPKGKGTKPAPAPKPAGRHVRHTRTHKTSTAKSPKS